MKRTHSRMWTIIFPAMFLGMIALVACSGGSSKPTVVIASPPSGSQYKEGDDVAIQSTSTDQTGVTRVELTVDGAVVRNDTPPSPQATLPLSQTWKAALGNHTLIVRAYNAAGTASDPAAILVTVSGSAAAGTTPTSVAVVIPSITVPVPLPFTGEPTETETIEPQPTSPQPTAVIPTDAPPPPPVATCSGTPNIAFFTASPTTINAGSSSSLSWGLVTNADTAEIDQGIGGVVTPSSRNVSPGSTKTYTLTARCGSNTATKQATITVNPPPPDVPAAPTGFAATTTGQTTASVTFADNANNEDGFKFYRSISGTDPQVGTASAHSGTGNVNANLTGLTCSESYTIYAKSYKGGSESAASEYATIVTDPCTPSGVGSPTHTGQTVTVTWNDNSTTPDESGFKIYFGSTLKKNIGFPAGTGARSTSITGLDCGTAYNDIRVSAYYGARESPKSSFATNATTSNCQVKVEFTKVEIKNDTDVDPPFPFPKNPGEIRLTFTVDGSTQYWPSSNGSQDILTGDSQSFSRVYNLSKLRSSALSISVKAQDVGDDPDDMGTVGVGYIGSPSDFGAGNRTQENSNFKIYYTITLTSPP